jgi:excisionase family DNA binding protein
MDTPEPLLHLFEAAAVLNLSKSMVEKLVASGALPVVRIGRTVRVSPADLDAFIASRTTRRPVEPPATPAAVNPIVLTPLKRVSGGRRAIYIPPRG